MSARATTGPSTGGAALREDVVFRERVLAAGLLYETGTAGVYVRSETYEKVVDGLQAALGRLGGDGLERLRFPPVIARHAFDRTGYLRSFPDLLGSVQVFRGGSRAHRELVQRYEAQGDWPALLEPAEVMLSSAACHPVYPMCTGRLPEEGRRFSVDGYCFRHEPSEELTRMQSFRMYELVYVGPAREAVAHRDAGLAEGMELLADLGLAVERVVAHDPFFGRTGALMAEAQRGSAAKYEGVAPVGGASVAVMSANYAADHFGTAFAVETADGRTAHSSCVAFGVDRLALALLSQHGLRPDRWPQAVTRRLRP